MALTMRRPSQETVDLVGALGGVWHGRCAMCRCPAHDDRSPSLSIRQGDHGILVTCFAGCSREAVLRELRRIPTGQRFFYRDAPTNVSAGAARLWSEAGPIAGTLAERYLARRGLDVSVGDARFHPQCPYRPKPWTSYHPALLLAVREGHRLTAVLRILLDPRTADYRLKVMLGRPGRGAWTGGGRVSSVLALAEGFETALAFTILQQIPCWASLGARRADQLLLPETLSSLILAMDDDEAGRLAADRATLRYARPGLVITRMMPTGRKDWAGILEAMRST